MTQRSPVRMTDRVVARLYQGDRMPYEITDHDRAILDGGSADAILAWCEGHPARYALALDALAERDDPEDAPTVAMLRLLVPKMAPLVAQAEYTDAAFASINEPAQEA